MSDTLAQLEQKLNVMQVVRDHPWPALALALGAGFALAGSRADVKAAAATVRATGGASSKVGEVLDDLAASVIAGVSTAFQDRIDGLVNELKAAIGAPSTPGRGSAGVRAAGVASSDVEARTSERPSVSDRAVERADRQLLGVDDGARRGGGDQLLGIDLPAQDSGAIRGAGAEH